MLSVGVLGTNARAQGNFIFANTSEYKTMGCWIDGYISDMNRTVVIGQANPEQLTINSNQRTQRA